ncbi:hypothetical protein LI295_16585, partial [Blautia wexlerae]|uniref:hypothetical protein n=2 Tax=Blautia TaxID=572511 RepID=UPI001D0961CF
MGLKERRKKIMALMLVACVAGTSTVPVTASDVSVFSDGTTESNETTTKYVNFIFETEDGENVGGGDIIIDKARTVIHASELADLIPSGYELCETGDIYVGNDSSVTIKVRKPVTTKYVNFIFETEDGENVGGGDIIIDKARTVIHASELADLIPS